LPQNKNKIARLEKELIAAKTDTAKIKSLTGLAFEVVEIDREKARSYALQALALSKKNNYPKGLMLAYYALGMVADYEAKTDSLLYFYNSSLKYSTALKEHKWIADTWINMGLAYVHESKFPEALNYYNKAESLAESISDDGLLAKAYRKKANLFMQSLDYKKGRGYILKSITIYERLKDSATLGEAYGSLGWAYKSEKKYDSTVYYLQQAIAIFGKINYITFIPVAYTEIGAALNEQGKYTEAVANFLAAERIYDTLNYPSHQDALHVYYGNALTQLNQLPNAKEHYLKGIDFAIKEGDLEIHSEGLLGLTQVLKKMGNHAEAIFYFEKYDSLRNVLSEKEQLSTVSEMTEKYEAAKKEKQIQEQQLALTKKNYQLIGAAGVLIALGLLVYSNYRRYRLKKEKELQAAIFQQQDMATKAVMEAEETERQRIAKDLHDGVGQMMSAAKMNLSAIESELGFADAQQRLKFDKIIGLVDESCKEVRAVSHNMMPNALLKNGLANAIKEFIDKIDSNVIKVSLHSEGLKERLEANTEIVLYRVIQECVNNVIKHSGASQLDISLIKDADGISATIEDNGSGFDTTDKSKFNGMGLKNIQTRVEYLKGTVEFDSTTGQGTVVSIHI
jgi:two-component system, NarL family, sensor kinase